MSENEMQYEVLLHEFINIINNYKKARDYYKGKNKEIVVLDLKKFTGDIDKLIDFNNQIYDLLEQYKQRITALAATANLLAADNELMFEELMLLQTDPVAKQVSLKNYVQNVVSIVKYGRKAS